MKLPNARLASKYSTYSLLFIVLLAATGVRLYRLSELPLGAFVDEIFMLDSSLLLLESPVDPIGHTLAVSDSWGKDHPNLFLYFNILILKIFGVSYWSMKLLSVIPGVATCYRSTASASATRRTSASSSAVKGSGSSLSTSI